MMIKYMAYKSPRLITSNSGQTIVSDVSNGKIEIYDPSGNLEQTLLSNENISGISTNKEGTLLTIGFPNGSPNIKTYEFSDGSWNEVYNFEYVTGTNLGDFVHLSEDNKLTVSSDLSINEFKINEYLIDNMLEHKATNISTISNINYPDTSTNFVIQLTTNNVSLLDIQSNIHIDPSNVATINQNSLKLTNYGFTLEGQLDVSGEHNVSGVKLFYEDFSSNTFVINNQDLSIDVFQFDVSSAVTYENYENNNITLTLNRSDLTNVDISNSLTLDPSSCGEIVDVSGTGFTREISFKPTFYILESDCSLTFHYNISPFDVSMTIPFSVDTLQQIEDISMNPRSILEPNSNSTLGVKFRLPVESSGTPDITISPSYIASAGDMTLNNDTWTGTITKTDNMNLLYNTIDFSYNGFDTSLNFNVAQNPELIVGPREIGDFIECNGIKITSVSLTEEFIVTEVEITDYDTNSFILDTSCSFSKSDGTLDGNNIMDQDFSIVSTIPYSLNEEEKYFNITFFGTIDSRKIKEITIYASHSVKIELLTKTQSNDYETITNLGQVNVDVSGTINISEASKQSTITRNIQSINLDPSNIAFGVNSANFEILFSTNDVSLNTIVTNKYLKIDPSNIGTITSQSLDLNDFKLIGNFEPNTGFDTSNNKLLYIENDDISGVHVFSLDSIQMEIIDVSINKNITYIDNSGTLNVEFTRYVAVFTIDQITINNSGSVSNLNNIDGYNWKADVLFPHTDTNVDVIYQIDVSFNSDVSFNLTKTYNTYVPQIANITNDNSFNYIDTSGTILLEFDKALLQDVELSDLSYNDAKMDLSLNKLSDTSYNLIVDPIGEYVETQVITVKDYLGADSSNISLEIDTIIPTFSEITLAPSALNYEVSGGILDVKFNKTLLDRDQLVLTSSSDISFTFLRQLDNNASSGTNVELSGIEPSLNNFTYTIEGDASENIIKAALQKWDNIIVRHPIDVNNGAPGGTTKIHITFSVSEMDAGTLGYAYVDYVYYDDLNNNKMIDYSDNIYTSSGFIALSQASYNSMISETRTDGTITNTTLYYVLMHEIGHIIGIGPYFGHNNSPRVAYQEEGSSITKYYYTGENALAKYKMYMNDASLVGIPIEDDGGAGTVNVHPEEHRIEGKTRHIGGHPHQGLDEELMTGWTESGNTIMPLSAVSIGFLEDMGYEVDYSYADEYRGINVDSNGNKIGTSLKMGITMDTTLPIFPTYSVVQYEVKSNSYGVKSIQDISFNYRGTHDVSNINIDVNTIIPDVASIDIQNILYSDTSGIVTITFNDHDGYYFHRKDASMNIYLDTSSNGNITLNMDPISDSSNVWTGVITTISGEFYPDAALYLQHSGMDGLINVDVSANYRLDTDIRGLYITLPEMGVRTTTSPHSQTINYLTYDHNTNKLETDVSFQFNIDVSNNLEQFPYIDICENFIEITSTDLSNGTVVLDKGIGFTGKFWNGILTISGEVEGTFDICYNETLNPLRDDEVVEIREDKLTVIVNTKLPDISNVIVPDKLTYLDISGDVEIEFDKAILLGDENNIQIEYSLEDTNEYQFLDKYGDNNAVSDANSKYVFNSISYDANKKIALGIGTYTLNVPSDHPIDLSGNYSNISITGTTGLVTINVTGDFGIASYKCSSHGYMGGQNRLVYKDVEVSSLTKIDDSNWKYTLSLPQEIDTSLNVTIKYRDETSGPYIRPIYGIVPDVSSVTLSSTDLTYNDPSCVVTVEFNNALQGRENIYDLISLEPSSKLFIQGANFSSIDKTVWTGVLDISNNVENEFAHIGAKVSVNGIQSDAFGQGISGEVLFNIDTILPDISNVTISKMGYSNKTSNFTITFTKDDLDGYDISNSLSVPSDFTIANVGLISGNTLTGDIQTDASGIEADVSFIIDYTFSYRNDTLSKQIYRATDFEVDTRERGIKTLLLTNDTDITNNGNSYLFTYLDNIGNLTLEFFTSDLSGIDVSSDMSFNSNINYSLSDNDINDTSLNAIITVDMSQNAGPLTFTYNDTEGRTSFQNNIFIDTRPRYIIDIKFSKTELTYVDKEGRLDITFNHDIFEDVDVITNLLNYPTSDLSLNNATITGSIWSCNLLSISELDGSFNVSLVYNDQAHSLLTPIILDTIIPRIDTSQVTDITNKYITYKNRNTIVKITFTNDIESGSTITDTLKLQGISDSSYSFVGSLNDTNKIEWNGQLTINEYDLSFSEVIIYSTYQGGSIIDNDNLKIDINTKRPLLKSNNITIDKDKFTYLEPSGTLSIRFEGENVLDTSINSFISTGSAITVGSMSRTGDTWTGNISINEYDISENQVINITNYYGQNASISVPFMTILPRINTLNNIVSGYTYLELSSSREIEFGFSGEVLETDIATFANNSISINNNDCSLNSFSRLTNNSIKANFVVNQESEIDDLKINFDYYSEYYDVSINQEFALMNVDTRIPNITEATNISNTNLTYDASSTQIDVYFDASLLDTSASQILDANLVTSFSDSSINISGFTELSKTHYRANITAVYGIDKSENNSVTVNYMDTSATLYFNVDTILRPYSNICFPRGEKVLTDNGYKNIEQIDIKLDTIRGEKIEELTQTQTQEKKLVLIKCGALMENMPNKDTLITNNHKVLYKGKLIEAYKLVSMVETGVNLVNYNGETLYNILLEGEKEGKMVVNGMIVETLSHTNNIARLYKKIRKYGTTEYKKKRMIELYNKEKIRQNKK